MNKITSEFKYYFVLIVSIILLLVATFICVRMQGGYQVKVDISQEYVVPGDYTVKSLEDIEDYKGRDSIFTIEIENNKEESSPDLKFIAYVKDKTDNPYEVYKYITKGIEIKYDENNIPIKFSIPKDAGDEFDYKIGVLEGKNLIYYYEGHHNPSQTIEEKLINEYKDYIIETQANVNQNKEIHGANVIENEINLKEYEEVLKADPENIETWPQFILDRIYNNEF